MPATIVAYYRSFCLQTYLLCHLCFAFSHGGARLSKLLIDLATSAGLLPDIDRSIANSETHHALMGF